MNDISPWMVGLSAISTTGILVTSWVVMAFKPLRKMKTDIDCNKRKLERMTDDIGRIQGVIPVIAPEHAKMLDVTFQSGKVRGNGA